MPLGLAAAVAPPCKDGLALRGAAVPTKVGRVGAHAGVALRALRLEAGASVEVDGPVFIVTAMDQKSSVAQETITQSYTSVSVTAKFKADSDDEAAKWAEEVQKAIGA